MKYLLLLPLALLSCGDFGNKGPKNFGQFSSSNNSLTKAKSGSLPTHLQNPNEGEYTKEKMIYNLGRMQALRARELQINSQLFVIALEESCESEDAKNALKNLILSFQSIAGVPFGPLQENDQKLFLEFYSWPSLNACGIDREVVKLSQTGIPTANLAYNLKGIGALEYLLFETSLETVCNRRGYPETDLWSKKPATEKKKDRCKLALPLAQALDDSIQSHWEGWNPQENFYAKAMIDGTLGNLQTVLNLISDSIFEIEKVKDKKLGKPLGLHRDCLAAKCLDDIELKYSDLSLAAIHNNLQQLEQIILGSKRKEEIGFGLEDHLRFLGRSDLADKTVLAIESARKSAEFLKDKSLTQLIREIDPAQCAATTRENRAVPVCTLLQDIRYFTQLLKTELMTVMDLRPPRTVEADND